MRKLWAPKVEGIENKIVKNGLESRKLRAPKVKGIENSKITSHQMINLTPSKIVKKKWIRIEKVMGPQSRRDWELKNNKSSNDYKAFSLPFKKFFVCLLCHY